MKRPRQLAALLTGMSLVMTCAGRADDLLPPCWRGQAGTTLQTWDFNTAAHPASPESGANPNGVASATVAQGQGAAGWIDTLFLFGTNQGAWDLGRNGAMTLDVPNFTGNAGSWKIVSIQVSQYRDPIYNEMASVSVPGATRLGGDAVTISTTPHGEWVLDQSTWLFDTCPESETIVITAGTNSSVIDQVIVDTLCADQDGGDVFAPCWRDQAGTTYQSWSFHNQIIPTPPERKNNPGLPWVTVEPGLFGLGWQDTLDGFGCQQGFWDLGIGGTMTFTVPDSGAAASYKYIRVQVLQFQHPGTYSDLATVSISGAVQVGTAQQQVVETTAFGGAWLTDMTVWRVEAGAASETVQVTAAVTGALISQVVIDTILVDFTCPSDIVLAADPGSCARAVTWAMPPVDGCMVKSVLCTPASGTTFPVGTTPVSCVITDAEGEPFSCNFTVTIQDLQPPMVHCPNDRLVAAAPGACGSIVAFGVLASDNCSGTIVTSTPPSGSFFPLGRTIVTNVAHDAAGNASAPCTFAVQVVDVSGDVQPPCWRWRQGTTFQHWAFGTGNTVVAPEFLNNAALPEAEVVVGSLGLGWQDSLAELGCKQGYWDLGIGGTITLTVPEPAGPAADYRYVRVQVTQYRDAFTFSEPAIVSVAGGTQMGASIQQPIETNDLGGQWIVDMSVWKVAPALATDAVVITSGLLGARIDQVVIDTLPMSKLACPPDLVLDADPGHCSVSNVTWTLPAVDGCIITNIGSIPPMGSTFPVGTNLVISWIFDREGGSTECQFNVVVLDQQPPIAVGKDIIVDLDAAGEAVITGADIDGGSTDNCGILSLVAQPSAFTCADVGANAVTLTVMDIHGNTAQAPAIVVVRDAMPPTIACPENVTVAVTPGDCYVTDVLLGTPVASDNCSLAAVTNDAPVEFPVGVTTVVWTAVDAGGNASVCLQTVTVTSPPVELAITRSGDQVVISWPLSCGRLQWAANLDEPVAWIDAEEIPVLVGDRYEVTIGITESNRFYRLRLNP